MGHNLNYNYLKQQYAYAGIQPAWHKLGKVVDGAMTSKEAIEQALLDYNVLKQELYYFDKIQNEYNPMPGWFCTLREDTYQTFGVVQNRYTILQNTDAFGFFDAIVGDGRAIYTSVGALGKGEVIFIVAKLPAQYKVQGDDSVIEQYLVLTNGHDGGHSLSVYFTPISVCCQNTLNASLKNNKHRITLRHTLNISNSLKMAYKMMDIVDTVDKEDRKLLNMLAEQEISKSQQEEVLLKAMKIEDKEKMSSVMKNLVASFFAYSDNPVSDSYSSLKGTKYAFYQDITGWLQHVKNKGKATRNMNMIMQDGVEYNISQRALNIMAS